MTLRTRAHSSLARSKRIRATDLAVGALPSAVGALPSAVLASEGAHLEPALYPKTDLTQLPHGWLLGQGLPPTPTPGTGGPVPFSRRPPPSLGAPESPRCPRSSVHLQAEPQVSEDFASELCESVSETVFQDATVPARFSGDRYLSLQAWPSEEGGAVCPRLKDGLQLGVSSGQRHSPCGTGAGGRPDATRNTRLCPKQLPRASCVEGPGRKLEGDGQAGARPPCNPTEAARSEQGPRWHWGYTDCI